MAGASSGVQKAFARRDFSIASIHKFLCFAQTRSGQVHRPQLPACPLSMKGGERNVPAEPEQPAKPEEQQGEAAGEQQPQPTEPAESPKPELPEPAESPEPELPEPAAGK